MSSTGSPAPQPYQSPSSGHVEGRHTPLYNQRRMASTGGGRAWSEEEENYLIETRQHKMPYKHIAAHLQKTELACRLHYHQLSFGTKRRRRTSSVSSARSACSNASIDSVRQQRPLPALSPPDSPESTPHGSARSQSPNHNPVPILPKPVANLHHPHTLPPNNALRLITQDIERYEERSRINKDRLARIYDAHRSHFWATIARDYGENVSPSVLEDVWRRGYASPASLYPPTPPNRSPSSPKAALAPAFPDCPPATSFQPVNLPRSVQSTPNVPSRSPFAIASLLTEDKEVRSPK